MDPITDPVDITGGVPPPQAFGFITGADTQIPVREICRAAEYFLPSAFPDFDRVKSVADLCAFFMERSKLDIDVPWKPIWKCAGPEGM